MRIRIAVLAGLMTMVLSPVCRSSYADPIRLDYRFTASQFLPLGNVPVAPVDPVTGVFSLTFDNSVGPLFHQTSLRLTMLNLSLGSRPVFSYESDTDRLVLGGLASGSNAIGPSTDDFWVVIQNASTAPVFGDLVYSQIGTDIFRSTIGTLTPTSVSPVPEPTSLLLLALSLAGLGVRRWRQGTLTDHL